MKFSVVIPTMWMANLFFLPMLKNLVKREEVGEVIIIDNNFVNRPNDKILNHEKINLVDFGKNIYYNKSMNVGVEKAKFELLCLMNDDIVFDTIIFKVVSHIITNKSELQNIIGMIYPHPELFNKFDLGQSNLIKELKLVDCVQRIDGFGCCMIMLKSRYVPIPQELVQHFGDVWLHNNQLKNGKKNFWLYNWIVGTKMRTTTEKVPEIKDVIANDWKIANKTFSDHGIELEDHTKHSHILTAGLIKFEA